MGHLETVFFTVHNTGTSWAYVTFSWHFLAEWKRIDPLKNADLFTADEDDESEEDQVKCSLKCFTDTYKSETTKF
jgi:hypothetical protein